MPADKELSPEEKAAAAERNFLSGCNCCQSVLLAFAALMLVARTGVGRAGIYADGVRRAWARIDEVSVTALEGGAGARVTWGARGSSRDLDLPGANPDEVREFVREMRRSH